MTGRFEGMIAVVTGAGSGIGAATARRLHAEGAAVALVGPREDKLREVAGPLGGDRTLVVPGDVSAQADVARLIGGGNRAVRPARCARQQRRRGREGPV